jgi:SAM-dependent methyltransferase
MVTKEIIEYYAETANREVRPDLVFATSLIESNNIAIDCGCGAGSDIAYLRKKGFIVYAFDTEEESIRICRERFKGDENIFLSQASFSSFDYPKSSLVVADASLFFCPETEFEKVWNKIYDSLTTGGIFCGSFLGPKDTMAGHSYDKGAYWSNILVFKEEDLRSKLKEFEVLKFTEHNVARETPQGSTRQWHIYSVVAKKI